MIIHLKSRNLDNSTGRFAYNHEKIPVITVKVVSFYIFNFHDNHLMVEVEISDKIFTIKIVNQLRQQFLMCFILNERIKHLKLFHRMKVS